MPGVLWRQEEDTKLMDAYGGKLKLTEMWVARHGGTEQGEMCCVFGRVGEGEICDVFLQVVIMCGLDQKKVKSNGKARRTRTYHHHPS